MSLKLSAYDTLACSGHVVDSIREALEQAYHMGELTTDRELLGTDRVLLVRGGVYLDQNITQFAHPIVIHTRKGVAVAVDVRSYGKYEASQGEFYIRDKGGYDTALIRSTLQLLWADGDVATVRGLSNFPLEIYCNWMGEMISKRLGLELGDQARLTVLAGLLYQQLFVEPLAPSQDNISVAQQLVRASRMKADLVMEVVDKYPVVEGIDDFCKAAEIVTGNVRMRSLNASTLLQAAGGFWYGSGGQARETIAVALEHPPTWISLMWQGLADRGMRNSGLTKIMERGMYRQPAELFQKQVLHVVRSA